MASLRWAIFDLNGTLLDPAAIAEPFGAGPELALGALDDAVLGAMALTLSGGYRPLTELLEAALRRRVEIEGLPAERIPDAMRNAAAMPAFPEAVAALDILREAGLSLAVLTNSATASAESSLAAAGLRERFAVVAGSDQVQAFKPDQRVYRRGLEAVGARAPEECCMVAAHWWDLLGARASGLRIAWVGRHERRLTAAAPEPDARGAQLDEVARRVAELAAR